MIGRVDFFNMPGNDAINPWPSELELLRNYLNKDHAWRHKEIEVPRLALLGDRFGISSGEAYAASGFRNFETMVGPDNITLANIDDFSAESERWISYLAGERYLWAYGCGGGDYKKVSELGTHGEYNDLWSADI